MGTRATPTFGGRMPRSAAALKYGDSSRSPSASCGRSARSSASAVRIYGPDRKTSSGGLEQEMIDAEKDRREAGEGALKAPESRATGCGGLQARRRPFYRLTRQSPGRTPPDSSRGAPSAREREQVGRRGEALIGRGRALEAGGLYGGDHRGVVAGRPDSRRTRPARRSAPAAPARDTTISRCRPAASSVVRSGCVRVWSSTSQPARTSP